MATIETKFELGQDVWFIAEKSAKPQKVHRIVAGLDKEGQLEIQYELFSEGLGYLLKAEKDLYAEETKAAEDAANG